MGASVALLILIAGATEIEPGVPYRGPVTLKASTVGVSFTLPKGWTAQLPPGGEALVMGHDTIPGGILATVENATRAEVIEVMAAAIPIEAGVSLVPNGPPKGRGTISASYTGRGAELKGLASARVQGGRAVAFVAFGPPAAFKKLSGVLGRMVASVKFAKVKKPSKPKGAPTGKWAQQIAGKTLNRFHTATGYTERQRVTLCRDGRAYWNFEGGGFTPGVASGAMKSNADGRWYLKGSSLMVDWNDGSTFARTLTLKDGLIYLDGAKWLREDAGC